MSDVGNLISKPPVRRCKDFYWLVFSSILYIFNAEASETKKHFCSVQTVSKGYPLNPISCTLVIQREEKEEDSFLETDCANNGFTQEKFVNETYTSPELGTSTKQVKFLESEIQVRSAFIPTQKGLEPVGTTMRLDTILLSLSGDWFGPFGSGTFKGKCF